MNFTARSTQVCEDMRQMPRPIPAPPRASALTARSSVSGAASFVRDRATSGSHAQHPPRVELVLDHLEEELGRTLVGPGDRAPRGSDAPRDPCERPILVLPPQE